MSSRGTAEEDIAVSGKEEFYTNKVPVGKETPTNGYAAKRPYCTKHSRAKIDIGGEMKCLYCEKEKQGASK